MSATLPFSSSPGEPIVVDLALTPRQRQVLRLVAMGLTAEEIGQRLDISARTARAHTDVLRVKLRATRSRHLAAAFHAATGLDPLSAA